MGNEIGKSVGRRDGKRGGEDMKRGEVLVEKRNERVWEY